MQPLTMKTPSKTEQNYAKLLELFPSIVTETVGANGEIIRAIDVKKLEQEINAVVLDNSQERYQFTWPNKKQAIINANASTTKTLRLDRAKSVGRDGTEGSIDTENIYIEGDNLDALKILQQTYLNQVKMIYIDPPYNTGKDFVYKDKFSMSKDEYEEQSGDYDEDGNYLGTTPNLASNGRFHTDWLNMIYPRLKLARDLLTEDGVIFISIDDNEQENLKKVCDEVFGGSNFVAEFSVASNSSKNNAKYVSIQHEYLMCYARSIDNITTEWKVKKNSVDEYVSRAKQLVKKGLSQDEIHNELLALVKYPRFYDLDHYTYADEKGIYQTDNPGGVTNGNSDSEIVHPVTKKNCTKPNGGWRYKEETLRQMVDDDLIAFGEDETIVPRIKRYLGDYIYQVPKSTLFFDSQASTKWLKAQKLPFDFAKDIEFLKYIVSTQSNDALILDFFSGSATTAHAVMQLNAEDGGKRRFIMVQLPEACAEDSEAKKSGYNTICEIGEERIRRAGQKIKSENPLLTDNLDIGFRVYKVDSSNMEDVYYTPAKLTQQMLLTSIDNIKLDRTAEDLLIQTMLELDIKLSASIEVTEIEGKKVFNVNDGYLLACFDDDITEEVVKQIALMQPHKVAFKNTSMQRDDVFINCKQAFKDIYSNIEWRVI